MAFDTKKTVRETSIAGLAIIAAGLSFTYFEDAWKAVGGAGSQLAATSTPGNAEITGSIRPAASPAPPRMTIESGKPRVVIDAGGWTPIVTPQPPEPRSVLLQANTYGHFHVDAAVNGKPVELMTDTGATYVALSYETAIQLGMPPASLKFSGRSNTANGIARVAPVTLDSVRIGDIEIQNVAAVVAEPGKMSQNLLGMTFIAKLTRFELRGSRLVMVQ